MVTVDRGEQLNEFEVEVECLMEALYLRWGYDFREYSRASLRRRVARYMSDNHFQRLCDLQHDLIRNKKRCVHFVRG